METLEQMLETQKKKTEEEKSKANEVAKELQALEDRYVLFIYL